MRVSIDYWLTVTLPVSYEQCSKQSQRDNDEESGQHVKLNAEALR